MAERLSAFVGGIPIFFIGVLVVFAMLFILIGFMMLLGYFMENSTKKNSEKESLAKASKAASDEAATAVQENVQDDLELVAVITAAIAASLGTTSDCLQVRSLRKVQRKSL